MKGDERLILTEKRHKTKALSRVHHEFLHFARRFLRFSELDQKNGAFRAGSELLIGNSPYFMNMAKRKTEQSCSSRLSAGQHFANVWVFLYQEFTSLILDKQLRRQCAVVGVVASVVGTGMIAGILLS